MSHTDPSIPQTPLQPTPIPPASPAQSVRENKRSPLSWLVVVLASLVILTSTAFPFVAQSYAASRTLGEDAIANAGNSDKEYADLGIRNLPLLSDEAADNWRKDPEQALQIAGEKAFGDQWSTIMSAPEPYVSYGGWDGNDFGGIGPSLAQAISTLSPDQETNVIDVLSLAILLGVWPESMYNSDGTDNFGDIKIRPTVIALSGVLSASDHFNSCDSILMRAYVANLRDWGIDPESLRMRWNNAIHACPDDPTPVIEYARSRLTLTDHWWGEIWSWGFSPSIVQEDLRRLEEVFSTLPEVPAKYVLMGDAYRNLVIRPASMDTNTYAITPPFTFRHYTTLAIDAYEHAAKLSSAPEVRISWASALLANGESEQAWQVLNTLSGEEQNTSTALHVRAAIELARDEPTAAQESSIAAFTSQTSEPVVRRISYDCGEQQPFINTRPAGSLVGRLTLPHAGGCGAAGAAQDFGFVPLHRSGHDTVDPLVVEQGSRNDARVKYFRQELAIIAEDWDEGTVICANFNPGEWPGANKRCDVIHARGQISELSDMTLDYLQDMYRRLGYLGKAKDLTLQWSQQRNGVPEAHERLGEILFLLGDYPASASASGMARLAYARSYGWACSGDPSDQCSATGPGWATLREAAAGRMSDSGESDEALLSSAPNLQFGFAFDSQGDSNLLWIYIHMEIAQLAFERQDYQGAISFMMDSIMIRDSESISYFGNPPRAVNGAQEQLISVSYFALGDYQSSLDWAEKALACDPYNPLYLEAKADAQRALGGATPTEPIDPDDPDDPGQQTDSRQEWIDSYEQVLSIDPSLFSSWNNLGVLHAQMGNTRQAENAFKQAIQARPDYGLAWFNLGAVKARHFGPRSFLYAQGALGKAGQLDPGLKGQNPVVTFDDEVYSSDTDVSKPIPADWKYSKTMRSNPVPLTASMILIIVGRLAWTLGKSFFSERWATGALRTWRTKPGFLANLTRWGPHPIITTLITLGALLWLSSVSGLLETMIAGTIAVALLALHSFLPKLAQPSMAGYPTPTINHESSPAASAITLLLAPFGLGFAPPAPMKTHQGLYTDPTNPQHDWAPVMVRRMGVIGVGTATLLVGVVASFTAVPLARVATLMGIILLSSALVPVNPLDGARLGLKRWIELVLTVLLIAVATLHVMQII